MFNINLIDWKKLQNPNETFTLLKPKDWQDREFARKIGLFEQRLLKEFLYLPDEYRNEQTIRSIVQGFYSTSSLNLCYEMGDFQGVVGFTGILPEYKCGAFLKIWDKDLFSKDLMRGLKDLSDLIMDQFALYRITVDTPDRRMKKFAKLAGFEMEAEQPLCFRWNDKIYTNYILSKVRSPKKDEGDEKNVLQR